MSANRSSHGWSRPDRAPALRRLAQRLEDQADRTPAPRRARELAQKLRQRASDVELGPETRDTYEDALAEIRDLLAGKAMTGA